MKNDLSGENAGMTVEALANLLGIVLRQIVKPVLSSGISEEAELWPALKWQCAYPHR